VKELVRMKGLEPSRDCSHSVLSAARLPFRHIRTLFDLWQPKKKHTKQPMQNVSNCFSSSAAPQAAAFNRTGREVRASSRYHLKVRSAWENRGIRDYYQHLSAKNFEITPEGQESRRDP
jgi:hypothetical protein